MDIETPTMKLALKVWWAATWRTIPLVLIFSVIAGVAVGVLAHVVGQELNWLGGVFGGLLGLIIAVKVIERLMTKGFGEYRLAVVRK